MSLGALVENNRLRRTLGVVKAYKTLMGAYRGEVICTVTTAKVGGVDGTHTHTTVHTNLQ